MNRLLFVDENNREFKLISNTIAYFSFKHTNYLRQFMLLLSGIIDYKI